MEKFVEDHNKNYTLTEDLFEILGYSSQNKTHLLKQYSPRFFPLPLEVINWSEYKVAKLAEKNIFNKLDNYRHDKTEWFYFKDVDDDEINRIIEDEFAKVQSFMEE